MRKPLYRRLRKFAPCVLIVAVLYTACSKATEDFIPRLQIKPASVELGAIAPGATKPASGEFRIVNVGTGTLEILGFGTSCGCTVPEWPSPKIPAGSEAIVKVRVNPRNQTGPQSSEVSFHTNDPATPFVKVSVLWTEGNAITLDPGYLKLGWIETGKSVDTSVIVELDKAIDPKDLVIISRHDDLIASLLPGKQDPTGGNQLGRSLILRVVVSGGSKQGAQVAELLLTTRSKEWSAKLPISWISGPPYLVSPSAIYQSGINRSTAIRNRLIVSSAVKDSFTIRAGDLDGEPLKLVVQNVSSENQYAKIVTFDIMSGESKGLEEHMVRLRIGTQAKDVLMVPVTFVVD